MQIATFVVAVVALATSMSLLGWNIAQFWLSGGRAKVELIIGVLGAGGVITLGTGPRAAQQMADLEREHGYNQRVTGVVVRNAGRAPITVQRWGISCPGTATYYPLADSMGPALPATIEAGCQQTWVTDHQSTIALAHASGAALNARSPAVQAVVELGTGQPVTSKNSFRVV